MSKWIRNLFVLILIILFLLAFSSSYFSLSIDNLAYVLAIGIDTSTENKLQVSFQFSTAATVGENGSTQKTPTYINTVVASSLSNAINLMNSYTQRQINLSHCKIIIFSEELAKRGISDEIYTLINDTQIRPSANIIVSKCDTKTYLENTKPQTENLISKYYEILANSSKTTGYIPDATLGDFFNRIVCNTCEATAILGGISTQTSTSSQSSQNPENSSMQDSQKDFAVKANESALIDKNMSENIGVAVFKGDKLVGELNALETISYLAIRNDVNRFLVSVPSPYQTDSYLDIYLTPENSVKISVDTSNGTPYLKLKAKFSGRIYSASDNSDFSDPDILKQISDSCNRYLEEVFSDFLYKTSKELKSDICGLGKYALSNFFTTQQFDNYQWLENYKHAFFDVEIDTSVKSGMVLIQT